MNFKKILAFSLLLVFVALGCWFFSTKKESKVTFEETKQIKEKYEKLNDTVRDSDNSRYQSITIDASIEIDELSISEAVDFVKSGSGILFIGAPWCPWCRNALPVLMDVARDNNLVIKYIDITDIRNIYEVKNGKLEKTQKEGEGYYELLSSLDSVLGNETYKLKDDLGKTYDTKEKRIYIPMTIAIKNGNIEGTHVSTVNLSENQTKYDKLDNNQIKELKSIYEDLISKTKGLDVCSNETMCD